MIFPTTATNDSNGNPTETIETGIGTTARKRKTNYAYNGDQNVTTQEIRILDSSDAFIYGIKKTFTYSGTSVASIAVEALLS